MTLRRVRTGVPSHRSCEWSKLASREMFSNFQERGEMERSTTRTGAGIAEHSMLSSWPRMDISCGVQDSVEHRLHSALWQMQGKVPASFDLIDILGC